MLCGSVSALCFHTAPQPLTTQSGRQRGVNGGTESTHLLCGMGGLVLAFDVRTGVRLGARRVFKSETVHGIKFLYSDKSSIGKAHRAATVMVVSGLKSISFFRFEDVPSWIKNEEAGPTDTKLGGGVGSFLRMQSQVQAVALVPNNSFNKASAGNSWQKTLIVGLAHNEVAILRGDGLNAALESPTVESKIQCQDRSLTYSMSIQPIQPDQHHNPRVVVASGTVFREILLWTPLESSKGQVLLRIRGHQGSIFDLAWLPFPTTIQQQKQQFEDKKERKALGTFSPVPVRIIQFQMIEPFDADDQQTEKDSDGGRRMKTTPKPSDWSYVEESKSYGHGARIWKCVATVTAQSSSRSGDGAIRLWVMKWATTRRRKVNEIKNGKKAKVENTCSQADGASLMVLDEELDEETKKKKPTNKKKKKKKKRRGDITRNPTALELLPEEKIRAIRLLSLTTGIVITSTGRVLSMLLGSSSSSNISSASPSISRSSSSSSSSEEQQRVWAGGERKQ
eukprot:jgi/Bigna1/78727/fgenesh1_pg.56_\